MSRMDMNLRDTHRKSSLGEFGGIAGGLPENVATRAEGDGETAIRPASPFTAMFSEGARGDAVLAQTIVEVKAIYRDALRASGKCLKTYQTAQQIENEVVTITTKAKSEPFALQQCQYTHIVIEGLKGRAQPIILNFVGVKGELLTMVSASHKFPTPQQNQASFFNTNEIRFSSVTLTDNPDSNALVQRFTNS